MALMKVTKRVWVDPPDGHLYGFPKIYEPQKDGYVNHWLIRNGYPKEKIPIKGMYIRWWQVEGD